ncbi:uncharacterized protein LOC128557824 isoform X2 [Mercenaria mercenaria]|uniref:uncharacterized protein LOC128557824 isoform X2 n=1 Tax=Mercenaria mercenaria TaxID=6596 RepID=UPI00234F78E7|nr:uncharacterized protein LOC128557824 isoform X2 [Mercenaria mercenaria]
MKQTIQDAKYDIVKKQKEVTDAIEVKRKKAADAIQGAKGDIETKQTEAVKAIRDANDYFCMKAKEATDKIQDMKADIDEKQKEAAEAITDITQKALQDALQEMEKHSVLERVERLELDSSVSKQRLTLLESEIDKLEKIRHNRLKQLDYAEGKQVLQKGLVTIYQNHYVKTSISPLKHKENNLNITEVYVAPKMVAEDNMDKSESQTKEKSQKKPSTRTIQQYREILQTNGRKHKNIHIVGGVGTGKSTFCKMMIKNWCSAVTDGSPIPANDNDKCKEPRRTVGSEKYDLFSAVNDGNINEMRKFEFLFFVPLQRMSGLGDITEMIEAIVKAFGLTTDDFIDRIFEQESERCLIVADGLDEWTYPKAASVLQHVSCGLPNRDEARRATLITLSRPSAKGILNMKSSEYDQNVELVGIISVQHFIEKYLSKFNNTDLSYCILMMKLKMTNHEHLEKTPLLLQQLVWLYGSGNRIGKSVSDTYSHLVNIMLGWSQNKEEGEKEDQTGVTNEWRGIQLPGLLQKFPRFEANKRFLVQLARVAFEALTSEMGSITFSPSHLRKSGVSKEGISTLIKLGCRIVRRYWYPQ